MTRLIDKLERDILTPYAGPTAPFQEACGRQFRKRPASFQKPKV